MAEVRLDITEYETEHNTIGHKRGEQKCVDMPKFGVAIAEISPDHKKTRHPEPEPDKNRPNPKWDHERQGSAMKVARKRQRIFRSVKITFKRCISAHVF